MLTSFDIVSLVWAQLESVQDIMLIMSKYCEGRKETRGGKSSSRTYLLAIKSYNGMANFTPV